MAFANANFSKPGSLPPTTAILGETLVLQDV